MKRHLNLIKSGNLEVEKRVFPRFPFSYLIFKNDDEQKTYEIKDISYSGMRMAHKDGECRLKEGDRIHGHIHWSSSELEINGTVRWVDAPLLGLSFDEDESFEVKLQDFLSLEKVVAQMKPIHKVLESSQIPASLSAWLRADGPFEIFVWQHNDHEISKIQFIMLQNYVEWNDGKGLRSGKILSVRNSDTPLTNEEEFEFLIDDTLDEEKLNLAADIVKKIDESLLDASVIDFLNLKFGLK